MEERNRKYAWPENTNPSATQGSNYMQKLTEAYASGTNEKGGAYRRQENVQIENNSNLSSVDDGFTFRKVSALINALEELKPHVDDIRDCLREREKTDPRERHAQREEILKAGKQNDSLKKEIADLQEKYDKLLAINKQCLQEKENYKNETDAQRQMMAVNEQRYNKLYQDYDNEVAKIKSLTEKNDKLQRVHNALNEENASLKNECSQTKTKFSKLQDEHRKLTTELSDCKLRLSRLMGGKLSNNNPDIADLSDANRPTKLGEMYQELYDNEWTEAFEQCLEEFNQDENKGIKTLLDLLQEIKEFCDRKAEEHTSKLKEAVAMAYDGARPAETPDHISRQIKDLRKQVAEISVPKVYQDFNVYCKNRLILKEKIQPFVKTCTTLCWLMTVQDPPVVFGPKPTYGEQFDTNSYRHYTSTGAVIEFCVWPTMLLHKDGQLLSKGVAQGRKPQFSQSVFSPTSGQRNDTASTLSASLRNVSTETYVVTKPFNERSSGISTPKGHESRQQIQGTTQNATGSYQQSVVNTSPQSSNWTTEQGTVASKAALKAIESPTQQEWDTFMRVGNDYGWNSDELKHIMKDRYDVCMNYYRNKPKYWDS